MNDTPPLILAFTGASGAPYGLRLLQCLLEAGRGVQLLVSKPARMVLKLESGLALPARAGDAKRVLLEHLDVAGEGLELFGEEEWTAPPASGSAINGGMVICPCTTGTLCSVAAGTSRNLIERAADVTLKERRPLILVPRETPYSAIHLEAMLKLAQAGAVILPPNPGFYDGPESIGDLVDFVVARILDHLGVAHELGPRWGQESDMKSGMTSGHEPGEASREDG